jgi:hypothetical protein
MNNYLLPYLNSYFEEIIHTEKKLFISETFLNNYKDKLKQDNAVNRELLSMIISYRDLSIPGDKPNLFVPKIDYSLDIQQLDNDITDVISHFCCLALSQAYEIFEAFLIDILTEFLFRNQILFEKLKWEIDGSFPKIKPEVRKIVKGNQGTDNVKLLNVIRKISVHFRQHERTNCFDVNITHWFQLLSKVRHTIIHNRQKVSESLLEHIENANLKELFEVQFSTRFIDNNVHIFLSRNATSDITCWLNSFAHFIFVSLSTEKQLSLEVPQFS